MTPLFPEDRAMLKKLQAEDPVAVLRESLPKVLSCWCGDGPHGSNPKCPYGTPIEHPSYAALDTLVAERDRYKHDLQLTTKLAEQFRVERDQYETALREIATGTKAWTREQMIDLAVAALSTPPNQEDK